LNNRKVDTLHTVETPEGALLQFVVAGPVIRGMAWLVDGIIKILITIVLWFIVGAAFFHETSGYAALGIMFIIQFLLSWFYTTTFEAMYGATPGKRIYGLRVVQDNATPVTVSGAIIRNFLRFVDVLPVINLTGLVTMLVDNRFRRLGDLAAGTVVIYKDKTIEHAGFAHAHSSPPPEWLSRDDRQAIVDFAERCTVLSVERQYELAAVLSDLTEEKESEEPLDPDVPSLYATLCQQHALATSRGYSHALTSKLHDLIVRAHHQLYKRKEHLFEQMVGFFGGGFARALRKQWKLFAIACALFFVPAFLSGTLAALSVDNADMLLGGENRANLEQMYRPGSGSIRPAGLEDEANLFMFGFYIKNNIGIDFQVFASGILFGLGTIFFSVFNGIMIGAAAGHLSAIGYGEKFWSFVPGHSAPELLALCVSATAGLMLGRALIKPGRQTRRLALLRSAKEAVPIIIGAGVMTLIAAFIEAYWSSQDHSLAIKVTAGVVIWIITVAYLALSGRTWRRG